VQLEMFFLSAWQGGKTWTASSWRHWQPHCDGQSLLRLAVR
jgi:hypothetical protein